MGSKLQGCWASAVLIVSFFAGCTHHQLRRDHVQQAGTLTDIYEQQVLDNLAMFVHNRHAVPFFAVPGGGTATVTDRGSLGASTLNGPGHTILGPLGLSRDNQQSWGLLPVTEPDKLRTMKAHYQAAICHLKWVEDKKCITRDTCSKTGSHCGCTITVCPESYSAFSELVLAILDSAVTDPSAPEDTPTIEVEDLIYNDNGRLEKIHRYTAEAKDVSSNESGEAREGAITAPKRLPEPAFDRKSSFIREQQSQLLRNRLFPE